MAHKASIFNLEEFRPYAADWAMRQTELAHRQAYYDGTIYANVRDRFMALGKLSTTLGPRVYRGTKALFLMLARAVDVDAGIIPGGWAFAPDAPPAWDAAARQVFAWSDWAVEGVLYVHYGAVYGVTGLKISDLRAQQRVTISPLDPCTFLLIRSGQYDPAPRMAIIVETRQDDQGDDYEYAEVISAETIRTFVNGEPAGIAGRPPEYPNLLGAVPVIERNHIHTGAPLGEATAQHVFPLLDEVNELASYLADIIKKHAEAQWLIRGAEESDLVKSGDNVWFIPDPAGDARAIVAAIDIPGVLAFIQAIRDEVQNGLPELAFAELKSKTQIATATLEIQLMELVLKIKRCRPNYDHGLADALRLAGRAGASMGLPALAALDDEALAFDAERRVLPLDRETELKLKRLERDLDPGAQPVISERDPDEQSEPDPAGD